MIFFPFQFFWNQSIGRDWPGKGVSCEEMDIACSCENSAMLTMSSSWIIVFSPHYIKMAALKWSCSVYKRLLLILNKVITVRRNHLNSLGIEQKTPRLVRERWKGLSKERGISKDDLDKEYSESVKEPEGAVSIEWRNRVFEGRMRDLHCQTK